MLSQNFIFSEKRVDRIKRHLLFWIVLAVYFAVIQAANPMLKPASSYLSNLPSALVRSFLMMVPQVFTAYTILYLVVPLYITKRQLLPVLLGITIIWVATAFINILISKNVMIPVLSWVLPAKFYRYLDTPPIPNFVVGLFSITKGVFTGAGFLFMLHYVKRWYLKEQRNLQLQRENSESQLKLLTAQVHPHFLFNTLNNIYSQTQTESPKGSKMIMELSDMLRYILTEGRKTQVPLQKELDMIQDYMNLEKIRYGNKLDLHISIPTHTGRLQIAPLLLLPFIENCFKHGTSKFLTSPWINLNIMIHDRQLTMKLMNGKESSKSDLQPTSGTGISNVRKRLELLYPGKHELQIRDEPEVFLVNLSIELSEEKQIPSPTKETILSPTKISYA